MSSVLENVGKQIFADVGKDSNATMPSHFVLPETFPDVRKSSNVTPALHFLI